MKNLRLYLCMLGMALACQPTAMAQKWVAGIRTGFTQDHFQFNDQFAQGKNLMWHNQVFIDYRLSKRWELELTIGYNHLENNKTFTDSEEPTVVFNNSWKTDYLTTTLNIKYYFFQKGKWSVFGQGGMGSKKYWGSYEISYTGSLHPNSYRNMQLEGTDENKWLRLSTISVGAGANYKLTSRLQLSGLFQMSYKTDNDNGIGSTVNQSELAPLCVIGIGYRF